MKHLKLRYKFGLIMLLLYLPAAVATYLLADVASRSINFAEKELAGARYLQELSRLHLWIGNHRSSLFSHLYATESSLFDTREKLQHAVEQVDLAEQSFGGELSLGTSWPELRREIGKLLNASESGAPLALEKVHLDVLAEFRQHWQLIGDQSNLILDPDLDSFYLMDAVLLKLPPLLELLNQYRALFADTDTRQLLRNPAFILHTLEIMGTDVATAINTAIVNNDALIDVLKADTDRFLEAFNAGLAAATASLEGSESNRQSVLFTTLGELLSDGYKLQNRVDEALMTLLEQRIDRDTRDRWVMLVLVLTVLHLGLIFTILVGKNIISGIKTAHKVALAIADDQLDNAIHATGRDEPGELLQALAVMQQKLNATITSEREKAIVNGRIKQALDSVTSVVLMASDEHKIIYCNNAAVQYFQTYQSELAVELPGLRHEQLLGQAADLFCPGELNRPRDTVSSKGDVARVIDRTIGGRNLRIKASPVYDSTNTALGTVIELTDRTQEVAIENAVSHDVHGLVCAALEGNLSQRIDGHGKPDFLVPVYKGINDMLDICSTVITSTGDVFQRMAAGDFSRSMQIPEGVRLKGDFAHLQQDAQATIEKLTDMIAGVKADACVVGDTAAKAITVNDVLEGNASSSSAQASGVSSGVSSISESVDTIASAAELLNTNIKEITVNTQRSTTVAQDAVKLSHAADVNVGELASSSRAIGDMIKVINSIAEQTNLLALNATIEAARAGETGKGFAVVANEVKELAKETAKATEDISQKIRSIQQVSDTAATGIRAIDEIIRQIDTLQQQIAVAMAQQSETTQEISRSISQVASHSGSMSGELSELVKGTHETTAAVNVMKSEVERLSDLARTMQVQFDRFQLVS